MNITNNLELAYYILEKYYNELYNYNQDSNYSNFDIDVAYTKERLEKIIINKFKLTSKDEEILKDIMEDNKNNEILVNAIKSILNIE